VVDLGSKIGKTSKKTTMAGRERRKSRPHTPKEKPKKGLLSIKRKSPANEKVEWKCSSAKEWQRETAAKKDLFAQEKKGGCAAATKY